MQAFIVIQESSMQIVKISQDRKEAEEYAADLARSNRIPTLVIQAVRFAASENLND